MKKFSLRLLFTISTFATPFVCGMNKLTVDTPKPTLGELIEKLLIIKNNGISHTEKTKITQIKNPNKQDLTSLSKKITTNLNTKKDVTLEQFLQENKKNYNNHEIKMTQATILFMTELGLAGLFQKISPPLAGVFLACSLYHMFITTQHNTQINNLQPLLKIYKDDKTFIEKAYKKRDILSKKQQKKIILLKNILKSKEDIDLIEKNLKKFNN